jgi:SAM-dependent methyltransferase
VRRYDSTHTPTPTRPSSGAAMTTKPHSPSCDRNKDVILDVLRTRFADRRQVLEIGSGTGQHAVHFAAAMPWLRWQCSDHADALSGIRLWLDEAALSNTPPPFALQAVLEPNPGFYPPPSGRYDAVFSANTLHIMGWPEVEALFAALPQVLAADAIVAVYGPFNISGEFTSASNRDFDGWLKARDPRSGIRDFEAVNASAGRIGLGLVADLAMPANNRMLVWRRAAAD